LNQKRQTAAGSGIFQRLAATADVVLETFQPGGNSIVRTAEIFAPECGSDHLSRTVSDHRLLLAVSDRPFRNDPNSDTPDEVSPGNYRVEAVWPFFMSCQ